MRSALRHFSVKKAAGGDKEKKKKVFYTLSAKTKLMNTPHWLETYLMAKDARLPLPLVLALTTEPTTPKNDKGYY